MSKNLDELEKLETQNEPNSMDGYIKLSRYDLPLEGVLYPESWVFAYRCPTTREVANFSTISETDQPAIVQVIEDLIRKCVIIYDTQTSKVVPTGQICDAHRTFFLLKLREQYLSNNSVVVKSMCQTCKETYDANLRGETLEFKELSEKLINSFDGRVFTLNLSKTIKIHVPTLDTASRVFKYIIKVYRDSNNQKETKNQDNIAFDKQFLLFAPYLFETGKETIRELTLKYKAILKDEKLFKDYLMIVNNMKLEHEETFNSVCPHCQSSEDVQIMFPGGYRKLFVDNSSQDTEGYF